MSTQQWCWNVKRLLWLCAIVIVNYSAKAQQTVDVVLNALNKADVCGDKEVVLTVGLNKALSAADSFLLFDAAVSYDPQRLLFVAPLYVGTIAESAEYKGSGRIDSATIRVYAFNIMRPMVGPLPLFGLLFRYTQDCPDTTRVWIPYEPDKNSEARIVYGKLGSALIEAIEPEIPHRSLTVQFQDSMLTVPVEQSVDVPIVFRIAEGTRIRQYSFRLQAVGMLELEDIRLTTVDSLRLEIQALTSTEIKAELISPNVMASRDVSLRARLRLTSPDTARIKISIERPICGCVSRVLNDSITIMSDRTISVALTGNNIFYWTWNGDYWILHGPTEHVIELLQWDANGRLCGRWNYHGGDKPPVALSALPWSCVQLKLFDGSQIDQLLVK